MTRLAKSTVHHVSDIQFLAVQVDSVPHDRWQAGNFRVISGCLGYLAQLLVDFYLLFEVFKHAVLFKLQALVHCVDCLHVLEVAFTSL